MGLNLNLDGASSTSSAFQFPTDGCVHIVHIDLSSSLAQLSDKSDYTLHINHFVDIDIYYMLFSSDYTVQTHKWIGTCLDNYMLIVDN